STTRLLQVPDAPPRLELVFQRYDPPLFFVTFNTHHRKKCWRAPKCMRSLSPLPNWLRSAESLSVVTLSCPITSISLSVGSGLLADTMGAASEAQFVQSNFSASTTLAEGIF